MALMLTATVGTAHLSSAQSNAPLLQITSPADQSRVAPGQTLSVTVTSSADTPITQVGVIGEDPIGFSNVATSVPAEISLDIPSAIACGPHMLTAMGTTASGQSVESATILIDIERADLPRSVAALMSSIPFESQGERAPIGLLGTFSDGSALNITKSSNVVFASSDTGVATVDSSGIVTAISTGNATITVTYTVGGQSVATAIPVSVASPTLSATPASLIFTNQKIGTRSAAQQIILSNSTQAPVSVVVVHTAGDFAETDNCISSSPLAPAATCAISVTFTPTAVGSRLGTLTIGNSMNITPATLSLTGTGIGQPATKSTTSAQQTSREHPAAGKGSVIANCQSLRPGLTKYEVSMLFAANVNISSEQFKQNTWRVLGREMDCVVDFAADGKVLRSRFVAAEPD